MTVVRWDPSQPHRVTEDALDRTSRVRISPVVDQARVDQPKSRSSCYTEVVRNVTITLDDETALWARMEAASRDTSVSRFVGELLRQRMLDSGEYARARRSYDRRSASPLTAGDQPYPTRAELHAR
jgi:hypothetical protein